MARGGAASRDGRPPISRRRETRCCRARSTAAAGNPGLQAILTRPILAREFEAAEEALRQIDVYRTTGVPPKEIQALIAAGTAKDSANALTAFFARLSFATYRAALTPDQARQLAAATHFTAEVPIPLPAWRQPGRRWASRRRTKRSPVCSASACSTIGER